MKRPASDPTAYWHALPLHYAPHLLATGTLWAQSRFAEMNLPLLPRATAIRRDRKLGLSGYVHLSLVPVTPLLRDKCEKGYPHVLLEFRPAVGQLPNAAYLRFNAKRWGHRDDFAPVTRVDEKAEILGAWRAGRYPSLELLVADALPLAPNAVTLHTAAEADAALIQHLRDALPHVFAATPFLPIVTTPAVFPSSIDWNTTECAVYFAACEKAGEILPPPPLPFD